jgi:hypothetical protein
MIRKLSTGEYRLYSKKKDPEDRPPPQPRNVRDARGRREARARGSVLQATLIERGSVRTHAMRRLRTVAICKPE